MSRSRNESDKIKYKKYRQDYDKLKRSCGLFLIKSNRKRRNYMQKEMLNINGNLINEVEIKVINEKTRP